MDRQDKVWERRDGAIKNQEKIRRDKEMELMNNAMKVMADKMAINADMSKKAARKEQEAEMQRGEVLKEKLLERKGEGKGLQERGFGLKLSMINLLASGLYRDIRIEVFGYPLSVLVGLHDSHGGRFDDGSANWLRIIYGGGVKEHYNLSERCRTRRDERNSVYVVLEGMRFVNVTRRFPD